jgi:hypothetical protein
MLKKGAIFYGGIISAFLIAGSCDVAFSRAAADDTGVKSFTESERSPSVPKAKPTPQKIEEMESSALVLNNILPYFFTFLAP